MVSVEEGSDTPLVWSVGKPRVSKLRTSRSQVVIVYCARDLSFTQFSSAIQLDHDGGGKQKNIRLSP